MQAALAALAALTLALASPAPAAEPGRAEPPAQAAPGGAPEVLAWPANLEEGEAAAEPPSRAVLARAYLVERVAFVGLDHVREWAARRHLVIEAGQTLDEQRVLVSRLRLL